jgi:hypothetical protein
VPRGELDPGLAEQAATASNRARTEVRMSAGE